MRGPDRHHRAHIGTGDSDRQPLAPAYVGLSGIYGSHRRVRMDMLEPAKRGNLDTYRRCSPRNSLDKRCRHFTANNLINRAIASYHRNHENFFSFFLQKIWWGTKRAVTLHRKSKTDCLAKDRSRQRSTPNFEIARKEFFHGVVVQLVRIPACHAGGRGFESRPYRQRREENE